ncbi:glycine cleavage system aminomethyltransferase GcvT [Rhodovibrio salinarum]|uniref:aminomethyltransferase n=1 Tax=Rhodovibrio salinarum TaxID=1087 RepID=A0A934UZJ6_9PROT|nr:glycine cleavage system aminomethyltransferase GcvT [Rhodovibrio salinarum]MBK1696808.1 glycine cleavage system aminomethyltransferase T [Rhodovibrio salinarum]
MADPSTTGAPVPIFPRSPADSASGSDTKTTPLTHVHQDLGAKMVEFAGYSMPVQYPDGIVAEHQHTRTQAGLFDISHMGQAWLVDGSGSADAALERLVPGDIQGLEPGKLRYTMLLNDQGGIVDDFMAARPVEDHLQDRLFLVVNAARKQVDFELIEQTLGEAAKLERLPDRALIALQGPAAAAVMDRLGPAVAELAPMTMMQGAIAGIDVLVSRSGYTGEDGFEISVPADQAETLFRKLLDQPEVAPVGLGARDSLRLEAGLCLYGHDLTEETTPVEASLTWTIAKRRRESCDFPGGETIRQHLENGAPRKRVGLLPEGRAPVREGAELHLPDGGAAVGTVTSGGFGPSVGGPVAMGYVTADHAKPGTELDAMVRGKPRRCRVVKFPLAGPKVRASQG